MSSKASKAGGRFDGQLSNLRAGAEAKKVEEDTPAPVQVEEAREKYSTYMRGDLKIKLKQAAAIEKCKQYEILEKLLEDYFKEKHPNL